MNEITGRTHEGIQHAHVYLVKIQDYYLIKQIKYVAEH